MGKIEGVVAQIDLNVKAILNKLNLISATSALTFDPPKAAPKVVLRATGTTAIGGPLAEPPRPTIEDVTFPQAVDPSEPKRSSVVEQRVVYSDGRPVILASVTVAEAAIKTNVIAKVKTDGHGKWHTQLFGGKYFVEIIKGPTAAKRGFKMEYEIEIPGDGRPLSLDRKQVE